MKWDGYGNTTQDAFIAALKGTPLAAAAGELYDAGQPYTKLLRAQLQWESDDGTSDLAKTKHNVLGQRPKDGSGGFVAFPDALACVRYWHDKLTDPGFAYANVATLEQFVHTYAPASDNNDEAAYRNHISTVAASLPSLGDTVTQFTTVIPGLPGGPLETTYPISINLIPASNTFQRPGIIAHTPRRSVQHGTGNPNNPDAAAEARYFVNGAEGNQASVHYCTDDTKAVVVVPLNEVTWQAADGNGPGNMNGFSCEMMEADAIWDDPARRAKLIALTADLMGRTAARCGIGKPEKHFDFNWGECCDSPCDALCGNRHHCPDQLMSRSLWDSTYVPAWQAARIDELRRMGGGGTTTTTTAAPSPYPAHRIPAPDALHAQGHELTPNKPNRFKCIQGTTFRTAPSLDAPAATKTPARAGRSYTFDYSSKVGTDVWLVSKSGSWAMAKNFEVA